MTTRMTPNTPLNDGEEVLTSFRADRATYTRTNTWMAVFAMAGGMVILWALGNPHVWTGAIGGLFAVAVRGFYMMSEELSVRWDLTNERILGPMDRVIRLGEIKALNKMGSVVQVVTNAGDKYLVKYQGDPTETIRQIKAVQVGGRL
ncbi:hypothetical protein SAMN05444000_10430 [Shimia gijangensis]|uniref:PH domain-containing protein n=1 Tax=Shimia gijangensis TaxID=1470563 RepID=A0A1M6FC32_9RHOB|nr:hypothetical protein [Shimia gijangensis]SHI95225.1 hypothetical protein SAMN05444000_10430 [Shimia gijangensis]